MGIMHELAICLQLIIALGVINVWCVRSTKPSRWRATNASNMKEEFAAYGLPPAVMYVVGGTKVLSAIGLVLGVWIAWLVPYCAAAIALLMLSAIVMHLRVRDPIHRSLPALLMLICSIAVVSLG